MIQQHSLYDTIIKNTIFDLGTVIKNIHYVVKTTVIWFSPTHGLPKEQLHSLYFKSYNYDTCKYLKNKIVKILLQNENNKVDKDIHNNSYVFFIKISK